AAPPGRYVPVSSRELHARCRTHDPASPASRSASARSALALLARRAPGSSLCVPALSLRFRHFLPVVLARIVAAFRAYDTAPHPTRFPLSSLATYPPIARVAQAHLACE